MCGNLIFSLNWPHWAKKNYLLKKKGIGASIPIGQEIQYLLYAGFLISKLSLSQGPPIRSTIGLVVIIEALDVPRKFEIL